MAFRESNGEFLWQQTHEKLSSGRANDWPYQGVAGVPLVEGTHCTTRAIAAWCGASTSTASATAETTDGHRREADRPERRRRHLVVRHDGGSGIVPAQHVESSPVIWGDLVFVSTSNGQDESHVHIPSPKAPAIIRDQQEHRQAGVGDNSVEDRILHGQWSTPSVGR